MTQRDYYQVLEVAKTASAQEIKQAYRKLAMKYHPDRTGGDAEAAEKFKEAKEAYEILSDENKRARYDQFGHAGVQGGMGGGGGQGGFGFGDIFEDIFGDIFGQRGQGGGRGRSQGYRGSDLQYNLELTLEQAVLGTEMEIQVPTFVGCKECNGSGANKGAQPERCETCEGVGQVRMQQGFFTIQQACPHCHGSGQTIKDPCKTCRGQGRVQERKKLSVKIPAGVDNGDKIRLTGEGEAGSQGGGPGDLYIMIHLKDHELFKRDGVDLHCEIPIDIVMATLGGEIEVPTLSGKVNLKIPTETQSGKVFRLRGKGVKSVRSNHIGDTLVTVVVETPVNLTKEQIKLFETLRESLAESGKKHSPRSNSWFKNVKKFFEDMKFG